MSKAGYRAVVGLAVVLLSGALPWTATPARADAQAQGQPAAAADPYVVKGFRSAVFGTDEATVRAAIKKDFGSAKVTLDHHPTEKTTILSVKATDLLPDTGSAQVFYTLGYKSKKLDQVNVVWGPKIDAKSNLDALVSIANQFVSYFSGFGWQADGKVVNGRLPNGMVLAFRGYDASGRMVAVLLSPGAKDKSGNAQNDIPPQLTLTYVLDPKNPDVYKIDSGAF